MMKLKTIIALVAVTVLLMNSLAWAAFAEDFEGMATADLSVSPWVKIYGAATIAIGTGTNTTNVLRLVNGDYQRLLDTEGSTGTVEFDLNLAYLNGSQAAMDLILQDSAGGWSIAYIRFTRGWGGAAEGVDLNIGQAGTEANARLDVMANNEWAHIKVVYNCTTEKFDMTVTSSTYGTRLAYQNQSFFDVGYGHVFPGLGRVGWYQVAGTAGVASQIDNVTINCHIISGNAGQAGVTMNGLPGNPVSLSDGFYSATVSQGWSGTVVPTLSGYTFSPSQRVYSNVTQTYTGQNYTAALIPTFYTISGNTGVGSVTLSGLPDNPVSSGDGSYNVTVPSGWSGTITPVLTGYTFSPTQRVYSNVMQDYTSQSYSATLLSNYFLISGTTLIGGVTLNGLPGNPESLNDGSYSIAVPLGWSGTVTPTLSGIAFIPNQRVYSNVSASNTSQYYTPLLQAEVQVEPAEPNSEDEICITLSGMWPDDAEPNEMAVLVSGFNIYFDVLDRLAIGSAVLTPWQLTQCVGQLLPGIYTVYGCVLPEAYNLMEWLKTLSPTEATELGLDMAQYQENLDQVNNNINSANLAIAQLLPDLYEHIVVGAYNETIVNLCYLRDEVEGLKRAIIYAGGIADTGPSETVAAQCDQVIINVTNDACDVCDDFYGLFTSSNDRRDPVAVLGIVVQDPNKRQILYNCAEILANLKSQIANARQNITFDLNRLRNDPAFRGAVPGYTTYVPAALPAVAVKGDGTLDLLIFGGPFGRVETMLSLGFDTLDEAGGPAWTNYTPTNVFTGGDYSKFEGAWDKYQVTLSDTLLFYALGDGMYRPSWFAGRYGENIDYYAVPSSSYIGTGCFDFTHPVPRGMILEYLQGAAAFHRQKEYTFIYKGPWEAYQYHGIGWPVFEENGYSVPAIQAFRNYLASKYGSINALNIAWGSSYSSFSVINPPPAISIGYYVTTDERGQSVYCPYYPAKRLHATPLTYEFERGRKDIYADYFADCRQAIKAGDPCHPLACSTSAGIMDQLLISGHDDLQMPDTGVDMWGKHPSGGYGWADSPYMWGLNRYFNKTLVSLEYYGYGQQEFGDDLWGVWQIPIAGATPDTLYNSSRRDAWHEYSWDRRMLLFYWPEKLVEIKLPPGGTHREDGFWPETSPLLRPWAGFIPVVKRRATSLNDIFVNVPIVEPNIGVIHPGVSIINAYPTDSVMKVTEDIFDRLLAKQYHFNVVAEEYILNNPPELHYDSLDNYDVIILPYMQYFDNGFATKLLSWVSNGGTLIAIGPFGLYNKFGNNINNGAALVYPGTTFSYTDPGYPLSWVWQASGGSSPISGTFDSRSYGSGAILMTLDGRALYRPAIGAAAGNKRTTRPPGSDIVDPGGYSAAQQAFYNTLAAAVQRKAWVTTGNVEMVIRQNENGQGPLYISVLNYDYHSGIETTIVVKGEYSNVTDLSIPDGFGVPTSISSGQTMFPIKLGPGEGLMLKLEQ